MHIKFQEGIDEVAQVAVSTIAVMLNELFGSETQFTSLEETEKVSRGQVIMPMLAYEPKAIRLKTTAIKNTYCNVRFTVYTKQLDDPYPCCRFINEDREITKQELIDNLPTSLREGSFSENAGSALIDIMTAIAGITSDSVSFFYDPEPGEAMVTHCLGVIHEFGEPQNPYCIATVYFSIEINK